ncbi:phosphatase PAP2 family protein [bacterium]|nr:MAG: phosphatase PAP2 family protein [bacterium]
MPTHKLAGRGILIAARFVVAFLAGRLGLAFLLALVAAGFFAFVAHQVREGDFSNFDRSILLFFRRPDYASVRDVASVYTHLGDGPVVGAVTLLATVAFILRKRFWPDGAAMLTAGVGGFLLIEAMKALFGRPRPEGALAAGLSFPSGHSFLGIAVYGFLASRLGIKARWWLIPCLAIGMTRPIVGAHYPTDVLAGWSAGGVWLLGCLAFPHAVGREGFAKWRRARVEEFLASRRRLGKLRSLRPELQAAAGPIAARVPHRWGRHIEGDLLALALLARWRGERAASTPVLEEGRRLIGLVRE